MINLLSLYPAFSILILNFYRTKKLRIGMVLSLGFAISPLIFFPRELILFSFFYALFYLSIFLFPLFLEKENLKVMDQFSLKLIHLQEEGGEFQKIVLQLSHRADELSLEIEKILERYNFARELVFQTEEGAIFFSMIKIFEKEKNVSGIAYFSLAQEGKQPLASSEINLSNLTLPTFSDESYQSLLTKVESSASSQIQVSLKSIRQQEFPPAVIAGFGATKELQKFLVTVPVSWAGETKGILAFLLYTPGSERFLEELSRTAQLLGLGFQKAELYQTIIERSRKDGLTQLYLRRIFLERLNEEIALSKRYGTSFSLLMLDLDHFKSVNDTYGHLAGDAVLQEVSAALKKTLHPGVMICRYGGEEFAVLIGLAPQEEVLRIAEGVRQAVKNKKIEIAEGKKIQVTVSIGAAHYLPDAPEAAELIRRADSALYLAKESGRNCVREWTK